MYLSRIPLNMARAGAKQLVQSPYKMHSAVEHAFPPGAPRVSDEGRLLWRLDFSERNHSVFLYVVSIEKPDFTHIVEQAGWPAYAEWETKDYHTLLNKIAVGQQWHFRLRANPVRRAADKSKYGIEDPLIGKIEGHVTVGQQEQWLLKRSLKNGFRILGSDEGLHLTVRERQKQQFRRQGATVTLCTALFDGGLEVTDVDAFRKMLSFGLGKARGFGCGLLTIAPFMQQK